MQSMPEHYILDVSVLLIRINEGGYEPEGSALYFALAGTYKPEIERIIKRAIKELLEETNTEREV